MIVVTTRNKGLAAVLNTNILRAVVAKFKGTGSRRQQGAGDGHRQQRFGFS